MKLYLLVFLPLLFPLSSALSSGNDLHASANSASSEPLSCQVQDSRIVLDFGATKHPTYVGVVTPDDRFVYLRYQPLGIDALGQAYEENPVVLDTADQEGFLIANGEKLPTKVFERPGEYELHFRDATTAEGMGIHRLTCSIDIDRNGKVTASTGSLSVDASFGCKQRTKTHVVANGDLLAGCRETPLCGFYPCCTQTLPGQPCFCDYCCVAKPPAPSNPSKLASALP